LLLTIACLLLLSVSRFTAAERQPPTGLEVSAIIKRRAGVVNKYWASAGGPQGRGGEQKSIREMQKAVA